jgi:hypothetical protein
VCRKFCPHKSNEVVRPCINPDLNRLEHRWPAIRDLEPACRRGDETGPNVARLDLSRFEHSRFRPKPRASLVQIRLVQIKPDQIRPDQIRLEPRVAAGAATGAEGATRTGLRRPRREHQRSCNLEPIRHNKTPVSQKWQPGTKRHANAVAGVPNVAMLEVARAASRPDDRHNSNASNHLARPGSTSQPDPNLWR